MLSILLLTVTLIEHEFRMHPTSYIVFTANSLPFGIQEVSAS